MRIITPSKNQQAILDAIEAYDPTKEPPMTDDTQALRVSLNRAYNSSGYSMMSDWAVRHGSGLLDTIEQLQARLTVAEGALKPFAEAGRRLGTGVSTWIAREYQDGELAADDFTNATVAYDAIRAL